MGNPTAYKNQTLQWSNGRNLRRYGNNIFQYGADNIRYKKNNTVYTLDGSTILKETDGTKTIKYYYGNGGVIGFNYNGADYYFEKNLQGDVIALLDKDGYLVAKYVYDAWGKILLMRDKNGNDISNNTSHIGYINPIRYRSYYYDVETDLYYLESRYYDPETGRFLNSDSLSYLGEGSDLQNYNLYSYCENNPVMYSDPSGHLPFFVLTAIIGAVAGVAITAAVDYLSDKEFNLHWGWYVGAGLLGAAIGAGAGMAVSYYATGSVTSSTGQVFASLFKSTSLYRTVGPDELADIKRTGRFNQGANSMEGKFFAKTKNGVKTWGKRWEQSNYVKIKVPKSSLKHPSVTSFKHLDAIDDAYYFSDLEYLNSIVNKIYFL